DVDPGLVQLIRLCLTLDPAAAPSAAQLLRLPYFASAGLEPHSSPEPALASGYGPGFNPNPLAPLFGLSGSSGAAGSSWAWLQSPQPPPPSWQRRPRPAPRSAARRREAAAQAVAAPRVPRLTRMLRGLVSVNCYSVPPSPSPLRRSPPARHAFKRLRPVQRPLAAASCPARGPAGEPAEPDSVLPVRTGSSCGSGSQPAAPRGCRRWPLGAAGRGPSTCAARSGSSGQVALSVGVRSAIAAFFEGEDAAVEEAQGCGEADGADEAAADTRRPLTKAAMPAVAEEGSLMNTAAEVWVAFDSAHRSAGRFAAQSSSLGASVASALRLLLFRFLGKTGGA
ncbi:hypothetical protein HYH03_019174, partial [Edaphochlamys debaryana]